MRAISVLKWAHFHRRRVPPHRRKPLRGASFIENSSVFVHYLRDPREKAGCAAWGSSHSRKGPLATSDGRQWGFSCQSAGSESDDSCAPVCIATSRVAPPATRWPTVHLRHATKSVRETQAKVRKLPASSRHRSPTLSQTVCGSRPTPAAVSRWSKIDPVDHPRHFRTS